MSVLNSRALRHVVTVQVPSQSQDDTGQMSSAYTDLATIRAKIHPLSGREFIAAQQVHAEVTTRITAYWQPGFDAVQRILHESIEGLSPPEFDVYDILAVLPDPESGKHFVNFMAKRRISEGYRRGE